MKARSGRRGKASQDGGHVTKTGVRTDEVWTAPPPPLPLTPTHWFEGGGGSVPHSWMGRARRDMNAHSQTRRRLLNQQLLGPLLVWEDPE